MENYKPNSFKSREIKETPSVEQKKVQKVVSGPVKTKKKSGFKKFASSIITEDAPKVKNYIIGEVLIPSIKKAISEIVRNGIDMFLYGDVDRGNRSKLPGSKVSYRSYYDNRGHDVDRDRSNRINTVSRLDYDDIVLAERGEAELVLTQLEEILDKYGFVTIADLYDSVGISSTNHCANNYGWTNLSNAGYSRVRDGYLLKLPRAVPID